MKGPIRKAARSDRISLGLDCPLLTPQQERASFLRKDDLTSRAAELESKIAQGEASPALGERVEALRAEAIELRNQIVEANLRLAVAIASKAATQETPLNELLSECLPSLLRAVELFDVKKGNNFSTYATHAVRHAIGRALQRRSRLRQKMVTTQPSDLDASPDVPSSTTPAKEERMTRLAGRALELLSPRERTIVAARYGLDGFSHEHTFREIGGMLGLSKERARVLAHQSLETLQSHFRESDLED